MYLSQITGSESFNGDKDQWKFQAFVFNILFMLNHCLRPVSGLTDLFF